MVSTSRTTSSYRLPVGTESAFSVHAPHHGDLILGPARLQRQSKHDPAHFESMQFALAHGAEEGALLQFWRPDQPQQMESFPVHLIQRLLKGFDEEARRYSTESTRELQVEWNKFPHITGSRTEYLRLRADSLQVRAAWLKHLSQQTGLVAEDPTEHLHTKTLAQPVGPAPSLNLGLRVTHADAAPSRSHGADDDSSEVAFNAASTFAFDQACEKGGLTLLEPVMRIEIQVPDEYYGGVLNDLQGRRAVVSEIELVGENRVIRGQAPLAEMFGYTTTLRSLTQGRATLSMEPHAYAEVPEAARPKWA